MYSLEVQLRHFLLPGLDKFMAKYANMPASEGHPGNKASLAEPLVCAGAIFSQPVWILSGQMAPGPLSQKLIATVSNSCGYPG
jgi:hypothetical protein